MSTQNLTQNPLARNGQPPSDNRITDTDAAIWLKDKVEHYTAEVTRLEAELQHAKALLKGHQIWLAQIERKAREQ